MGILDSKTATVTQNGKHLPGLAPVTMQEASYVASYIADRIAGKEHSKPFYYFNKGTLATVGRSFAVVDIGIIRFTGLLAWFTWLLVHLLFLIGFRNRLLVLLQYAWVYFTFQNDHASFYQPISSQSSTLLAIYPREDIREDAP